MTYTYLDHHDAVAHAASPFARLFRRVECFFRGHRTETVVIAASESFHVSSECLRCGTRCSVEVRSTPWWGAR